MTATRGGAHATRAQNAQDEHPFAKSTPSTPRPLASCGRGGSHACAHGLFVSGERRRIQRERRTSVPGSRSVTRFVTRAPLSRHLASHRSRERERDRASWRAGGRMGGCRRSTPPVSDGRGNSHVHMRGASSASAVRLRRAWRQPRVPQRAAMGSVGAFKPWPSPAPDDHRIRVGGAEAPRERP